MYRSKLNLERIYFLTPIYFVIVFGIDWYRAKDLKERIERLERAAIDRENLLNPPEVAKE